MQAMGIHFDQASSLLFKPDWSRTSGRADWPSSVEECSKNIFSNWNELNGWHAKWLWSRHA